MPDPIPAPSAEALRLKRLFASPRFFWITVLYSAGSLLALFSGSLNLFGAIISIGLWMLVASAREPEGGLHPRGLAVMRGCLSVLSVLLWVAAALTAFYALLLFSMNKEDAPTAAESAMLFGGLLTEEQAALFWQYGGLILLGLAVLLVLMNLFYFRRGRYLAVILLARHAGASIPLPKLRGLFVWMLLFGLVSFAAVALSLPLSRSMVLPAVSDCLTGAGRILGAFFLLRELGREAAPEEDGAEN
jgi:hypothetical protein